MTMVHKPASPLTPVRSSPAAVEAVLIVGMHRSGTSCLAGSLQQYGLYLGRVFEWSPHNLKGNRENMGIVHLNDAVLTGSGGAWDQPPAELTWNADQEHLRDRIIRKLKEDSAAAWGFKDPRTLFTLPFWKDGLENFMLVGTFRHPLLVARSLQAREGMPAPLALELWRAYNQRLLGYLESEGGLLIPFDLPESAYQQDIQHIARRLGLKPSSEADAPRFIDEALKHQRLDDPTDTIPMEITRLYQRLLAAYETQQLK